MKNVHNPIVLPLLIYSRILALLHINVQCTIAINVFSLNSCYLSTDPQFKRIVNFSFCVILYGALEVFIIFYTSLLKVNYFASLKWMNYFIYLTFIELYVIFLLLFFGCLFRHVFILFYLWCHIYLFFVLFLYLVMGFFPPLFEMNSLILGSLVDWHFFISYFFFIFSLYIQHSSLFISIHFRIRTGSSNFIRLIEVLYVSLKCSNWFLNSICWLFENYYFQIGSFIHTIFLNNLTGKVILL